MFLIWSHPLGEEDSDGEIMEEAAHTDPERGLGWFFVTIRTVGDS